MTWETNTNFNAGVEFGFLGNRISGDIEYYNRKTTDMLMSFPVPPSMGYSSYYANVGDMVNKGVEVDLNFTPILSKHVQWDINLNMTYTRTLVTSLPAERKTTIVDGYSGYVSGSTFIGEGLPMYSNYLRRYAGVSADGQSLWYTHHIPGTTEQIPETTTTNYDDADQYICASALPDLTGGFGTSISFYGFDFSANFNYQIGGRVMDAGYAALMGQAGGSNVHKDILKSWTPEHPSSTIPRVQYQDTYASGASDRFLTDASYLNLQNLNFGYTLPSKITKKFGVQKLRVYLSCENVFYVSARKGFDPRYTSALLDGSNPTTYSPIRTISGGINLQF